MISKMARAYIAGQMALVPLWLLLFLWQPIFYVVLYPSFLILMVLMPVPLAIVVFTLYCLVDVRNPFWKSWNALRYGAFGGALLAGVFVLIQLTQFTGPSHSRTVSNIAVFIFLLAYCGGATLFAASRLIKEEK